MTDLKTDLAAGIVKLIAARVDRGLTRGAVADLAYVVPETVDRIEDGIGEPKMSTLARYAAAVGYRMNVSFEPLTEETTK